MAKSEHKHKEPQKDIPLTIIFVRHAQASQDDCDEELGPHLTELGRQQAERVAKRMEGETFDHIYSSDLSRAWETTQAILRHHHHSTWTVSSDLREVSHHHFAPGRFPLLLAARKSAREERTVMERFATHLRRAHIPGEKILVVCHGNVIRSIIPILAGRKPENAVLMDIHNTAVTIIEAWPSGEAVIKLANCVQHLNPKQVT